VGGAQAQTDPEVGGDEVREVSMHGSLDERAARSVSPAGRRDSSREL
jgi:hypothetical protein